MHLYYRTLLLHVNETSNRIKSMQTNITCFRYINFKLRNVWVFFWFVPVLNCQMLSYLLEAFHVFMILWGKTILCYLFRKTKPGGWGGEKAGTNGHQIVSSKMCHVLYNGNLFSSCGRYVRFSLVLILVEILVIC